METAFHNQAASDVPMKWTDMPLSLCAMFRADKSRERLAHRRPAGRAKLLSHSAAIVSSS